MRQGTVAIDTETLGFNWFDGQTAFMVTWSWAHETEDHVLTIDNDPEWVATVLSDILASAERVVYHNAKFDCHQLLATWGVDVYQHVLQGLELHDTDSLARVVVPFGAGGTTRYKLKHLGNLFLGAGADEEEQEIKELAKSIGLKTLNKDGAYYAVWRAYPDAMTAYAKKDTRLAVELFAHLMEKLDAHPNQRLKAIYELERRTLVLLLRAERRGVAVDRERVDVLRTQYRKSALELHKRLAAVLGEAALTKEAAAEEDTNVTNALREALLEHGVPLYKRTDSGLLSTAKFALQEFEKDYPVLADLREWRRMMKFLATYIDPLHERDVVHCSFAPMGAWTGRMSCRSPNMQNLPAGDPEGARSVFIPRPGYAFCVLDYSSIEAFGLAYYLGHDGYRELVAERDPHAWLTSLVDHGDDHHVGLYLKGTPGQARRDDIKNVTYAIMYGAGRGRITDMLQLDPGPWYDENHPEILAARARGRDWPRVGWQNHEAAELIKRVKRNLPGFTSLNRTIQDKVKRFGHVNTVLGRHNSVNKDKAYVGMNALIQGSAADICKVGACGAQDVFDLHPEWDAMVLLVVHDELVVECREEHADAVYSAAKASMEESGKLFTPPVKVEGTTTTTNYGSAK